MTMQTTLKRLIATLVVVIMAALVAPQAFAIDKITLKDGRTIEGEIIRELDGAIWFKHKVAGIEKTDFFTKADYTGVEREAAAKPADDAAKPVESKDNAAPVARKPGVPRAAVITLGDTENNMVGMYITVEQLRRSIPLLQEEGVDVLVIRVNSGGGALIEMTQLANFMHEELKPKFRTVGWIHSAISAAAMMMHSVEELYFTSEGNYGACTGFSGPGNAMKGRGLEEVLQFMEKVSRRGGRDTKIMRAMQISAAEEDCSVLGIPPPTGALSATINPDGTVTWYQDSTSGEHVLNPKGGVRVLTFNAVEAEKFKFSRGTTDTVEGLGKLMGYQEVDWVGKNVKGVPWPVCKAEQLMMSFRDKTAEDEANLNRYWTEYNTALAVAASAPKEERGKFINIAQGHWNKIKAMVKNNPNFLLMNFNMRKEDFKEFVEQQEKRMRDLMK